MTTSIVSKFLPKQTSDSEDSSASDEYVDTRSASAKAMALVTQITTISITMVLPALGGYYIDQYLKTIALFFFLGMVLGIIVAGYQLFKLVNYRSRQYEEDSKQDLRQQKSERKF